MALAAKPTPHIEVTSGFGTRKAEACSCQQAQCRCDTPLPCVQVGKVAQKLIPDTSGVGHSVDLAGTPYSLSEDFVSSYRMHPLLPDTVRIDGDTVRGTDRLQALGFEDTRACRS